MALKIQQEIEKDLQPGGLYLHLKLFFAVTLGGIVSLSICGQFGMGVTGWAESLSHSIHENMPSLLCAAICGTLYAVFPTLILRVLLCSPMQFRMILKQRFVDLSLWYGVTGILLASYGQHGQGTFEIILWSLSAVFTSYILASIMRSLLPHWSLPEFYQQMLR